MDMLREEKPSMKHRYIKIFIVFVFLVVSVYPCFAHKVSLFAYSESGRVYTESYFPDGSPVIDGDILVYDSKGNLLVKGKTNKKGLYDFKIHKYDNLKIVLNASMGHRAEFTINKDDLVMGEKGESDSNLNTDFQINGQEKSDNETISGSESGVSMGNDEFRKIISEELSKQLKPVIRKLTMLSQHRVGITEILGGIGYIIGLMGISMYFLSKKSNTKN